MSKLQGALIAQFGINIQVILNSDFLQTFLVISPPPPRFFKFIQSLVPLSNPLNPDAFFSLNFFLQANCQRVDTWHVVIQKIHCPFSPPLMSLSDKIHMLCDHHGN